MIKVNETIDTYVVDDVLLEQSKEIDKVKKKQKKKLMKKQQQVTETALSDDGVDSGIPTKTLESVVEQFHQKKEIEDFQITFGEKV